VNDRTAQIEPTDAQIESDLDGELVIRTHVENVARIVIA
jgi:hypothetical protein